jgi:hypothetical protein
MTNDESRLRVADYLSHMLEAARLAREYVEGVVKASAVRHVPSHRRLVGDRDVGCGQPH